MTRHLDGKPFGAAVVGVLTLATGSEASLTFWALVAVTLSAVTAYCLIFRRLFSFAFSAIVFDEIAGPLAAARRSPAAMSTTRFPCGHAQDRVTLQRLGI